MILRWALVLAVLTACRDRPVATAPEDAGSFAVSPPPSALADADAPPSPEPTLDPTVAARVSAALVAFGRDEDGPLVQEALPSRRFCFDGREVFLADHPKTAGIIEYAFVLAAFEPRASKPAAVVASERKITTLGTGSHFLVLTKREKADGGVTRGNLGSKDDWGHRDAFVARAFEELGRTFDVSAVPDDVTARPAVVCSSQPRSKKHFVAPDAGPPPEEVPVSAPGASVVVRRDPKKVSLSHIALDANAIYWTESDATSSAFDPPETIWAAPRAGGEPRVVARGQAGLRGLRSSGSHLYWARDGAITRVDVAGGQPTDVLVSKEVKAYGSWVLVEDEIFYAVAANGKTSIRRVPAKGGASTLAATIDENVVEMTGDHDTIWMTTVVPRETARTLMAIPRAGGPVVTRFVAKDHAVSHLVAKDGAVYWTSGGVARVYRLGKDDAQPKVIADEPPARDLSTFAANGIVDLMLSGGDSLYLMSWGPYRIRKVPVGGGPLAVVQSFSTGSLSHELAVDERDLYLATVGTILRLPP